MSAQIPQQSCQIVVFDLGGVLARICHSWEEAAATAGIATRLDPSDRTPLTVVPIFDAYQAGAVELSEYLEGIAKWLGVSPDEALAIHNHILVEPYPGTDELVEEIEAAGLLTGCLSNTNAPHWEELALNGRFPAIMRLQRKMASHLVGLNKPDPEIFALYAKTNDVAPESIVYFEDHPLNVRAALGAGWRAKLIDPMGDTVAQMREFLGPILPTVA